MRLPSVNYGSTCRYKRKDVTLPLRHYCPFLTEEYNIPIAMLCDAEALPTYGNFPTLDPSGLENWYSVSPVNRTPYKRGIVMA